MSFDFARVLNGPQPVTQLLEKIEEFGGMRAYDEGKLVQGKVKVPVDLNALTTPGDAGIPIESALLGATKG